MEPGETDFNWDSPIDDINESINKIRDLKSKYRELLRTISNQDTFDVSRLTSEDIVVTRRTFPAWNHKYLKEFIDIILEALKCAKDKIIQRMRNASKESPRRLEEIGYEHFTVIGHYIKVSNCFGEYLVSKIETITNPAPGDRPIKNVKVTQFSLIRVWKQPVRTGNLYSSKQVALKEAFENYDETRSNVDAIFDDLTDEVIVNSDHLALM